MLEFCTDGFNFAIKDTVVDSRARLETQQFTAEIRTGDTIAEEQPQVDHGPEHLSINFHRHLPRCRFTEKLRVVVVAKGFHPTVNYIIDC